MTQEETDALFGNMTADAKIVGGDSFSDMDLGILGEIYNISMGAAATAVSSLLSMKVDITAPQVEMVDGENLMYQLYEPAVGVEIKYVQGIEGLNIFILSQLDVMKIVDILLGGTGIVDEASEFNDMHMSAIGEVMNQMMGQSSMSLANFLDTMIDISVPETYKIEGEFNPAKTEMRGRVISTRFKLIVGEIINSEMLTTCTMSFARNMIDMAKRQFGMMQFGVTENDVTESENDVNNQDLITETEISSVSEEITPAEEIQPQPERNNPAANMNTQPQAQYYSPPVQVQAQMPPTVNMHMNMNNIQNAAWQSFDAQGAYAGPDAENNPRLRSVPVDVTVEIGKTKKLISEILEFGEGSVIELDKQSSEPVDIFVNGVLFAKGSVVVVEGEMFAVEITEIL